MRLEQSEHDATTIRRLHRVEDDTVFAYARGQHFIRQRDQRPWAHLSNGQLFSDRSGSCLAYKIGSVYYDAGSHEALYYEP